jgi:hypothetical protein
MSIYSNRQEDNPQITQITKKERTIPVVADKSGYATRTSAVRRVMFIAPMHLKLLSSFRSGIIVSLLKEL